MIYASFSQRLNALIIDSLILSLICFVIGLIIQIDIKPLVPIYIYVYLSEGYVDFGIGITMTIEPIGAILTWLYYSLWESSYKQATPGKILTKIKVTDLNQRKISIGRASARFWTKIISYLILVIGYIMAAYTEKKQALHDKISGCLVLISEPTSKSNDHT